MGAVQAVEHGERRSLSDLYRRRAAAGDPPEYSAPDRRVPRRESRAVRPGFVAHQSFHRQRRLAIRLRAAARDGRAGTDRPLRLVARLRRHLPPDVEQLVAAHVARLRRLRERQDGGAGRVQPIRDRGHHWLRADLQPDRAHDIQHRLDGLEQGRHRAGRARLRVPDGWLRDQSEPGAGKLRRARAVGVRSEPGPPVPAHLQRRRPARAAAGHVADGRVDPQRLQEPDRAQQRRAVRVRLHSDHGVQPD